MTAKDITLKLLEYPRAYITDVELTALLGGTAESRYGKVKRLIAEGKLLHMRRGLYLLTKLLGYSKKPHNFELAQIIYAPSYISLESALSYHQLIPEAVYGITSVCAKRSKSFATPLGTFSYLHIPLENFYTAVERITEPNLFFMAKPWKAICDYVFCYKKEWRSLEPLSNSLRISNEDLPVLEYENMEALKDYYRSKRIDKFLHAVIRELKR
jgi:hypothetical protein